MKHYGCIVCGDEAESARVLFCSNGCVQALQAAARLVDPREAAGNAASKYAVRRGFPRKLSRDEAYRASLDLDALLHGLLGLRDFQAVCDPDGVITVTPRKG